MGEDERFKDIIEQEFHETVGPKPEEPPAPETKPSDDFHLDLYMDEDEYRTVDKSTWTMSTLTRWGLVAIGLGILLTILRIAASLPIWTGWVAFVCIGVGIGLCIAQAIRHRTNDDDGTAI